MRRERWPSCAGNETHAGPRGWRGRSCCWTRLRGRTGRGDRAALSWRRLAPRAPVVRLDVARRVSGVAGRGTGIGLPATRGRERVGVLDAALANAVVSAVERQQPRPLEFVEDPQCDALVPRAAVVRLDVVRREARMADSLRVHSPAARCRDCVGVFDGSLRIDAAVAAIERGEPDSLEPIKDAHAPNDTPPQAAWASSGSPRSARKLSDSSRCRFVPRSARASSAKIAAASGSRAAAGLRHSAFSHSRFAR
jgi:hypothetical protein